MEAVCPRLLKPRAPNVFKTQQDAGYLVLLHAWSPALLSLSQSDVCCSGSDSSPCLRHVSNLFFVVYCVCLSKCVPATLLQLKADGLQTDEKKAVGSGNRPTGNATQDQHARSQTFQTTLSYTRMDLRSTKLTPTPIPAGPPSEMCRPIEHGLRGRGMGAPGVLQTCIVGVANNSLDWASRGKTDSVCEPQDIRKCCTQMNAHVSNGLCSTLGLTHLRLQCRHGIKSPGTPSLFGRENASRTRPGRLLIDPWCSVSSVTPATLCEGRSDSGRDRWLGHSHG